MNLTDSLDLLPTTVDIRCIILYGPEAIETGKRRHDHALCSISKNQPSSSQQPFEAVFFVRVGGRFEPAAMPAGMSRARVYAKRNLAYVNIDIPSSMLSWSDERYRDAFCEFIRAGSLAVSRRIKKRKLLIDADGLMRRVEDIVSEYRRLQLPLPPIPNEAEQIRYHREVQKAIDEGRPIPLGHIGKADFYIYFKSSANARAFKTLLAERGYSCRINPSRGEWLCLAQREISSQDELASESTRIDDLARLHGGNYDGWEVGP